MKGYKCRMGIEEGTYRDCPALDIGGCGFTAEEGPPANCDAIEYELIPTADYDAQRVYYRRYQTAIAAAEEANAPVADAIYNEQVEPRLKDVIILVEKIDALAQLRAAKGAAGKCNS